MERDGYVVYRGLAVPVPAKFFGDKHHHNCSIFNTTGLNDFKRLQRPASGGKEFTFTDKIARKLRCLYPGTRVSNWVVLTSTPGCADQMPHTDWELTNSRNGCVHQFGPSVRSFGAIVALQDNTRLHVWPGSHRLFGPCSGTPTRRIRRKTLRLNAGDVCVFRHDLVHAGAGYTTTNHRLHAYMDHPAIPRKPNRTYLIQEHAPREIANKILA